ncbi:RNA polymerase sigma factor [Polyangium aurulentum]|uniref:RNA polymerase sigma factor n=1 Tax=Polyangium aurulentum TaxID=2567896 RepID=UPI00146EA69D|nr:sigma-70 family RNA polymerase sigma factor [Polyangium aurulentum]UQA55549.1 sigma-70 family RNA polymerase sigma factor [Polyangium aurulentum]
MTSPDERVGALFREHRKAMKAALRRLSIDGVDADDLVQNIFYVAHQRSAKLPQDAEGVKRWLLDVARKHAANWHRLSRHQCEVLGRHELVIGAAADPADPEAHLALRDIIGRALGKLDEDERRILMLHHMGGATMQELGELLGLTKSGAHVRLRTAEERMRKMVRRYQAERCS